MPVDLRIHSVYLLASLDPLCAGMYYVGYTTDPLRRLRQHNGELLNGAHRTSRKGRPWCLVAVVSGFGEDRCALRFEWSWQYPAQAVAAKGAAQDLRKARISPKNLPYAVAVLHRLLQVEPFSSVKLTLFVLRPDLFFPLSVAVGSVVPPPPMITAALAADNNLAGPALASKVTTILAAVAGRNPLPEWAQLAAAAAALDGSNNNANAPVVSFHTLEHHQDAEAKLLAFLGTADTSINSPHLKSSQQRGNNNSQNPFDLQQQQQQKELELSDVDSSDTDTADDTRRLEEVGCIGCTLCGKSAPSILLLMRCPGNFVEQRNRAKATVQNADVDGEDDQQQKQQNADEDDGEELLCNMPSCTMQCHVSCLAVWFQCCQEESRAEAKAQQEEQQRQRDAAEAETKRKQKREELDLTSFGLDSLGQHQNGDDHADGNQEEEQKKRLAAPELADKIPMPPASGFSAPCPICGCALHWPLLVAALKERLRRFQQRIEVKRRLAVEMRRVGLKVQARETTARGRKKNAAAAAAEEDGTDFLMMTQQQQQQSKGKRGGRKGKSTAAAADNSFFASPPGLPLATRRERDVAAGLQNGDGDDVFAFGGGAPATPANSANQQQPQKKLPGRTRFIDTTQGKKDLERVESQKTAGEKLAASDAFSSALPSDLFL